MKPPLVILIAVAMLVGRFGLVAAYGRACGPDGRESVLSFAAIADSSASR